MAAPPATAEPKVVDAYGKLPLSFEADQGQSDARVKFLSRGSGYTLFLTSSEAVLLLHTGAPSGGGSQHVRSRIDEPVSPRNLNRRDDPRTKSALLRIGLVGASPAPQLTGLDELPGKANYFIGNDPKKWRSDVPTYAKVKYDAVYPGVDLVYYGNQRQLEHDFIVAPGADPGAISLRLEGAKKLSLDLHGDLVLKIQNGEVRLQKPVVYQEVHGVRQEIAGGYKLRGENRVGFEVATYDVTKPLVIDPTLVYSTYIGGSGDDRSDSIAVDSAGSAYVTGHTSSTNFPTTTGASQTTFGGGQYDAFVTKLSADGSSLVYSTYLGGSGDDVGASRHGIAVDSAGSAYVTGYTTSTNFPTTTGAYQTTFAGGQSDAFVTKLNAAGSGLVYSTYLGGGQGTGIAVDSAGSAYVIGANGSTTFVTKLNATGSGLVYTNYLSGNQFALGLGIAVDSAGSAYVTGYTRSTDFPTTPGAFQTAHSSASNFYISYDAFVTKFSADGSSLVYSTYLGGTQDEYGIDIAVDSAGSAYVTGFTFSTDFPTTTGAFQTANAGGYDTYVTKLNAAGSGLLYSTYLGGSQNDFVNSIAVDSAGSAYVTGSTSSSNFPTTTGDFGAFQGYELTFVTKLNAAGSGLVYSAYLGSGGNGSGIAVDSQGSAYVTGNTGSTNFPTTTGAFQTANAGGFDAFVAKMPAVNTPAGTNVGVQPTDTSTSTTPVTLSFSTVTQAGFTNLTTSSSGPTQPAGFNLGSPAVYYSLTTTAAFTGPITVCINYAGVNFTSGPQLFHFEGGNWVDVTVSVDTLSMIICGNVSSLSPFAIFQFGYAATVQQPINADGSSVFSIKRGVVPVKFTLNYGGVATCNLPSATISLFRTAGAVVGAVDESVYLAPSDSGSNFRIDTSNCQYVYNVAVTSLGTGSYRVNISIGGRVAGYGVFGLQ